MYLIYFILKIWKGLDFIFGNIVDMLAELSRREKEENIKPDPDIDIYQKVSNQIDEPKRTELFMYLRRLKK